MGPRAHPRSRGADTVWVGGSLHDLGSSPLARGGRPLDRVTNAVLGLIPARAGRTEARLWYSAKRWAHPRSRGADRRRQLSSRSRRGSSPLARGGPIGSGARRPRLGLIPARAGRTKECAAAPTRRGAHPRSRGADFAGLPGMFADWGSSPLARGGRIPVRRIARTPGLIPARAGRTVAASGYVREHGAHPRSRGADQRMCRSPHAARGSSPLARGGPARRARDGGAGGLIPARAGRTALLAEADAVDRAHPRSRGADWVTVWCRRCARGSSPLARGGPLAALAARSRRGLIPARAGRTGPRDREPGAVGAHPRSRGADPSATFWTPLRRGSSPLARGGPDPGIRRRYAHGLIPVRAGRTPLSSSTANGSWAHPRSRGADPWTRLLVMASRGSSPLARGGLWVASMVRMGAGLIPARAGRTRARVIVWVTIGAHPRSRGADAGISEPALRTAGSSPLARGGLGKLGDLAGRVGLIPARAGRTAITGFVHHTARAHPRSRGADLCPRRCAATTTGSSPLARGGRLWRPPGRPWQGLIPARAGRTGYRGIRFL